jgi:hypothetical protein
LVDIEALKQVNRSTPGLGAGGNLAMRKRAGSLVPNRGEKGAKAAIAKLLNNSLLRARKSPIHRSHQLSRGDPRV